MPHTHTIPPTRLRFSGKFTTPTFVSVPHTNPPRLYFSAPTNPLPPTSVSVPHTNHPPPFQCYTLSEAYEDVIEEWYYHHQESRSLVDYMCRDRYLVKRKFSNQCLIEERDDKLVDKDRQLAADYDIRDKTASKKEKEARKEWAEIKQRTREQEEADLAAGKGAKGDSGSVRERSERIKKNEL